MSTETILSAYTQIPAHTQVYWLYIIYLIYTQLKRTETRGIRCQQHGTENMAGLLFLEKDMSCGLISFSALRVMRFRNECSCCICTESNFYNTHTHTKKNRCASVASQMQQPLFSADFQHNSRELILHARHAQFGLKISWAVESEFMFSCTHSLLSKSRPESCELVYNCTW